MKQLVMPIVFRAIVFAFVVIVPSIVGFWLSGYLEIYFASGIPQVQVVVKPPKIHL
ncbi:hypothetical protein [Photobacterium alginatilyticum]|uniref:hypothetical protein n=1 Tax=Photobacterium alginatilyticum TaxID=1775171 RepID=UPI001370965A|nr:hypothetical protein [Photobacterium alginatilyticum]